MFGAIVAFGATASVAAQSGMQVIYSFAASGDPGFGKGSGPESGVYVGPNGNLFGTTYSGGAVSCGGYNCGALYWTAPAPGSQIHLIHSFKGHNNNQDGYFPTSNVVALGMSLVGTTKYGGSPACMQKAQPHCGVIFVSHLANDQGYRIVHDFSGGADGGLPNDLMVSSQAPETIFGTTSAGGTLAGAGTVFQLVNKNNSWKFQTLYTFKGGRDGGVPNAGLIEDGNGNLYGTTSEGGNLGACPANSTFNPFGGCGTVFALTPPQRPGGKWKQTVLYAFGGRTDGSKPNEALSRDAAGNLFGTTVYGGSTGAPCTASGDPFLNGCGTVFEVSPSAGGFVWSEAIVYRFQGYAPGFTIDGQNPRNLVQAGNGNLFGATRVGGTGNLGTLFKLTKTASGGFTYDKIFDFCPSPSNCQSGGLPNDGLAIDSANLLYGTALQGGSGGAGVIFRFNP